MLYNYVSASVNIIGHLLTCLVKMLWLQISLLYKPRAVFGSGKQCYNATMLLFRDYRTRILAWGIYFSLLFICLYCLFVLTVLYQSSTNCGNAFNVTKKDENSSQAVLYKNWLVWVQVLSEHKSKRWNQVCPLMCLMGIKFLYIVVNFMSFFINY